MGLSAKRLGRGPRVVLVHASALAGELTWRRQLPLAERWSLVIVERAGYGASRTLSRGDNLSVDVPLVADLLNSGTHLVGQSSGAVVAMLAAAERPEAVLSLTLSEPPAFQAVPDSPAAQETRRALDHHLDTAADELGPAAWLRGFVEVLDNRADIPDTLPPPLLDSVSALRTGEGPRPWDVELPLDRIAGAPYPKLVISGNHSPAFEAVCDEIRERLDAARAYVEGVGHTTPLAGVRFNDCLEAFLRSATNVHC
jgi:pimeloyl-ACP methyl ester carboxylesterase